MKIRGPLARGCVGALCLLASWAGGCATLSEAECRSADWYTIGYEDGAQGQPAARVQAHRRACAAHGVAPDLAAYRSGRDAGLPEFCRPEVGYALGARGRAYADVCPDDLEGPFLEAYASGQRWKAAADRVSGTSYRISTTEAELESLARRIREKEREARLPDLDPDQRADIVAEAVELAREQVEVEQELARLREDLAVYQAELAELGG